MPMLAQPYGLRCRFLLLAYKHLPLVSKSCAVSLPEHGTVGEMNNIPVIFRLACHNSRSITTNVGGYSGNKTLLLAFGGQGGWQAQGSAWALSVSFGPFTSGQTDARTFPYSIDQRPNSCLKQPPHPSRQHECVSELARERQP